MIGFNEGFARIPRVMRREWLETSWIWKTARRLLRRARQRFDQAAQQSMIWRALARSVGSIRSADTFTRQAMGYVIAGGLCGLVGLMVFGSRSLGVREVTVRSVLFLCVVGVMVRCVGSAGK